MFKMFKKLIKLFFKSKPTPKIDTPSFDHRMKALENYFKKHSESNNAFIPEYETARKINQIALREVISFFDIQEIVKIFNETNLTHHNNGSAWIDLKIHIHSLILKHNLVYKDLQNGNIELSKIND